MATQKREPETGGEMALRLGVNIGIPILLIIFTLAGFKWEQVCDRDNIYLWCRLHPMTGWDVFGLILFYGGCLVLSGLWKYIIGEKEGSEGKAFILWGFIIAVIGIVIIWNA